jgi:hypothetical protein
MAERVEGRCVPAGSSARAEAAIDRYALVRFGTTGMVEAGSANGDVVGVAEDDYAIGDAVAFTPINRIGMHICIASKALAIGDIAYQAANGKISDTGSVEVGVCWSATGSDGDYVSVVPTTASNSLAGLLLDVDTALLTGTVNIVTGADATKGVILPTAAAGIVVLAYNTDATAGLKIYPATGDDINDGTVNVAIVTEGKTLAYFVALDTATWSAIYTADA